VRRPRKGPLGCVTVLLAAALGGCTVGPDFHPAEPPDVTGYLPTHGASASTSGKRVLGRLFAAGADVPSRWWEAFQSRHLSELVEQGIAHNADLQAAEAAVRVAQANALAQRGTLFPQLGVGWDTTRQLTPSATLATNAASGANLYTVNTAQVSVAYVADVFGGRRRAVESAEAAAEAQAFQREGVYLTLTSNIALAAIQEASLRGQIAATQRLISLQTQLLATLQRQNNLGQIALPEVVQQETALAQTKLLLPPLQKQRDQQRNLLATLTGRFPSEAAGRAFDLVSFRFPRKLPLSLPADLVRQRPDIRAAEQVVRAANADVGVAIANRLPQISIGGNAGSAADAVSRLFLPGTNFWLVGANVMQPIFEGGTLRYKQQAAEEGLVQAVAQYRSVVLTAFQNVADVLGAIQADARALEAAIAAERSAQRSIELVQKQVEQGQVSLPNLINAQQAYLVTSLARVQAQAARLADVVALFQALGGGWWNRWEAAVVPAVAVHERE
jgi:NodT family efflux transporter outer membrane factor (OMF) lipoprotein